jgi:hypothetical protein
MFKTEERVIGGLTYKVSQLGAIKGREAFLRLFKCLGPMAGTLANKGEVDLATALQRLEMTAGDLAYFCDLFAEKTFVVLEDKRAPRLDNVFDTYFAGKYLDMVQWLAFAVEVNFRDFWGAAKERAAAAAPPSEPMPPEPN